MTIDFHTHIFPREIAARAVATLQAGIQRERGYTPQPLHDSTVDGLRRSMADADVAVSVVMPIATNPHGSDSLNRFAASLQSPDVHSFASVHPLQPDWESALERIAEQGFVGIKLHPQFQGFYIDSPEGLRVLRKAEQLGLYVTVHAGRDVGMPEPVRCTPERLLHALDSVSGERVIAAHMGGYELWDDVERLLAGTPLLFDTALTARKLPPDQYLRIIRKHGARKVLFGSDSPWENPADTRAYLRTLGLTADELRQIESANALRILGAQEVG